MQISEKEFLSENPHWAPNVTQDATPTGCDPYRIRPLHRNVLQIQ